MARPSSSHSGFDNAGNILSSGSITGIVIAIIIALFIIAYIYQYYKGECGASRLTSLTRPLLIHTSSQGPCREGHSHSSWENLRQLAAHRVICGPDLCALRVLLWR